MSNKHRISSLKYVVDIELLALGCSLSDFTKYTAE